MSKWKIKRQYLVSDCRYNLEQVAPPDRDAFIARYVRANYNGTPSARVVKMFAADVARKQESVDLMRAAYAAKKALR